MLIAQIHPLAFAVHSSFDGPKANRIAGVRVMFPDIGRPTVEAIGFLRYPGEKSIVKPEATQEELSLPEGLTNHL
jgi:hypothetical protein